MTRGALVLLLSAASCAASGVDESAQEPEFPEPPPLTRLIESPRVAPPANDIPESKRIAWLESHRPKAHEVRVVVRERVVDRDAEPVRWERGYARCRDDCDWALPLAIGLGFWGGHWRHHHGWSWSIGWRHGWPCW